MITAEFGLSLYGFDVIVPNDRAQWTAGNQHPLRDREEEGRDQGREGPASSSGRKEQRETSQSGNLCETGDDAPSETSNKGGINGGISDPAEGGRPRPRVGGGCKIGTGPSVRDKAADDARTCVCEGGDDDGDDEIESGIEREREGGAVPPLMVIDVNFFPSYKEVRT